MFDTTFTAAKVNGVGDLNTVSLRGFNRIFKNYVVIEKTVNSEAKCFMLLHPLSHFIPGISRCCTAHPLLLCRWIIGNLTLVKIGRPPFSIPESLVLLKMFIEQSIDGDIIAVYNNAVFTFGIFSGCIDAVVCTPQPEVIGDNIATV